MPIWAPDGSRPRQPRNPRFIYAGRLILKPFTERLLGSAPLCHCPVTTCNQIFEFKGGNEQVVNTYPV